MRIWYLADEYPTLKLGIFGDLYTDLVLEYSSVKSPCDFVFFIGGHNDRSVL